jgi:hypothetical protein
MQSANRGLRRNRKIRGTRETKEVREIGTETDEIGTDAIVVVATIGVAVGIGTLVTGATGIGRGGVIGEGTVTEGMEGIGTGGVAGKV